jgi:hypothetical protein
MLKHINALASKKRSRNSKSFNETLAKISHLADSQAIHYRRKLEMAEEKHKAINNIQSNMQYTIHNTTKFTCRQYA